MRNLPKVLWERYVVWKYTTIGLEYGDAVSYLEIVGPCYGFNNLEKSFFYWQNQYKQLGYVALDLDTWVAAGGYGGQYRHLLRVRPQ